MNHTKLIYNQVAGKGLSAQVEPEVLQLLEDAGLKCDIDITQHVGHAIDLAYQAARSGYSMIISAGGDGTSNEVLNGLMKAKKEGCKNITMAVIPVGRGNDFAYSMGVPGDYREAIQAIQRGEKHPLDVGLVFGEAFPDGRYFGNGVGIGFDAVVGFEAAKLKVKGFMGYVIGALKTIFLYNKAPLIRLELDDEVIEDKFLMVSIMNGRRMGGTFMMAPQSLHDDGKFHLCIAGNVSKMGVLKLIPHFMKGTQEGKPAIKYALSSKVRATALTNGIPAHADGETVCVTGKEVRVEILPAQIDLIY